MELGVLEIMTSLGFFVLVAWVLTKIVVALRKRPGMRTSAQEESVNLAQLLETARRLEERVENLETILTAEPTLKK